MKIEMASVLNTTRVRFLVNKLLSSAYRSRLFNGIVYLLYSPRCLYKFSVFRNCVSSFTRDALSLQIRNARLPLHSVAQLNSLARACARAINERVIIGSAFTWR